ncbi:agrin-like isoform X3 [Penaeus indicus]|uniref:agrin-like isoform X3 n=1 Tax=Penaeus indicus TaxID=29960 RepID=UPI00300C3E6A
MLKTCWLLSLFLLASGQETCDFACPDHIDLVCGSDGVTYPNLCVLELADCLSDEDITLAHPGPCETKQESCDMLCYTNYDPVCGSDGVTYSNLCNLEVADCLSDGDITLAYEGECKGRVTEPCGYGCPEDYDPVCGSDGVTYSNLCELERENCKTDEEITVAYGGACREPLKGDCDFPCPDNYDPVCGSDGVTYSNLCELERANCQSDEEITVAYEGECKGRVTESCDYGCPDNYDPVCGSNGVTYSNLCELERANCQSDEEITVAYEGECKGRVTESCDYGCPDNYDPVCGSNGVTYSNLCELERANCQSDEEITVAYEGECKGRVTESCDYGCPDNYDPVCGSNGVTYSNLCELERANCKSDEEITVAYEGECKGRVTEPCGYGCPDNYDPVCGSNGVTYSNLCELERANCKSDEEITVAYEGECKGRVTESCDYGCPENYDPVCGSDGVTYSNLCELERANCQSDEEITVAYSGECKSCDFGCSGLWDPVCGSDGVTYSNPCQLEIASCLNGGDISLAYPGECKARDGPCDIVCTANYDPVCGSDGNTYGNACELEVANCMSDDDITLAYPGECKARDGPCDIACTANYDPVCGSDGNTYGNACELEVADCMSDEDITLAYPGECKARDGPCDIVCTANYDPVCGSDGNTYGNACELEVADCMSDEDITLAHSGPC